MSQPMIKLPDQFSEKFLDQLVEFGHFLESNVRPGSKYDLKKHPNDLWLLIEAQILRGLEEFAAAELLPGQVLMLQWYNSGVFIKSGGKIAGFDILPIPRFYGWPEPPGLTEKIAEIIDCLMITHDHADHYDEKLVKTCVEKSKPVFMHPRAAPGGLLLKRLADGGTTKVGSISIKAMYARHVWRKSIMDVPLAMFEVEFESGFRMIFCGDGDYTNGFKEFRQGSDALFITWRNPGPIYEDGHPEQKYKTIDAVNLAIHELSPACIILQHYGELDHIYKGFSASYEMAADLVRQLSVKTTVNFWGDVVKLT